MSQESKINSRRWTLLGTGAVVVLIMLVFVGTYVFGPGRQGTIAELLQGAQIGQVQATAELCRGGDGPVCDEGWRTDVGHFLRFDDEGDAKLWELYLGDDGRRLRHIVLDMRQANLTFEQRRMAIDVLYSTEDLG